MSNSMKESLMGMAQPTGVKPTMYADKSTLGLNRMVRLIAKVYSSSYDVFAGANEDDVEGLVNCCVADEKFMSMFARRDGLSDGDAVAVREALRWSGYYITTGKKKKIRLALIEPYEHCGLGIELAAKPTSSIWNSIVLSDYMGTEYEDYGMICKAKGKSVNIVQKSLDSYDVIMGGTES